MRVAPGRETSAALAALLGVSLGAPARALPAPGAGPAREEARPSNAARQSDAEAARRRLEIVRSPYSQAAFRKALRGGEVLLAWEDRVPGALVDDVASRLESAFTALFDRDGFARPFSAADPLTIVLVGGPTLLPASAGWEGRSRSRLVQPVAAVSAAARPAEDVARDVVRTVATLSLRQAAPSASGWLVEGMAEWLCERGLGGPAGPSAFLAPRGSLAETDACAAFLAELASRLPRGVEALRAAWEERPEDPASFLRRLAAQAAPGGLSELLAQLVVRALAAAAPGEVGTEPVALPAGETSLPVPGPLGWAHASFACAAETSGGAEVSFAVPVRARSGRGLVVYRGDEGEHDAVPLDAAGPHLFPLSGVASIAVILVDGEEDGEASLRLRPVPGYPASVSSSSVVAEEGEVRIAWRTAAHTDLLAWVVSRYEEDDDGRLRLVGREVLPTTDASDGGFSYQVLDRDVPAGARLRYRVSALTRDGLVSRAFEAAVPAAR